MDLGLQNAIAVVTGGSSGIGLETARLLLGEGARVAICGRDAGRLERAATALREGIEPHRVLVESCDVCDPDAVNAFAASVEKWGGGCDILVNNAGQGRVSTFASTSAADWRAELDLKFFSQINPIHAFKAMLDRSERAAIVGVNSLLALQPEPHMVCTASARAGVQALLKSLAGEFAPKIRVNSILLGVVDSGQWQRRFEARDDKGLSREDWYAGEARARHIPLGRFGAPVEPARAITFLASPAASFITGARLEVSGGTSRFV